MQFVTIVTLLTLTIVLHSPCLFAGDSKTSCATCRTIVDNFVKGLDKTAKKNFGGGNTAWEERALSKYETSEIRLVEILENLCDSSSFECNHMVEEHEEQFENWWFKKKDKYPDLLKWFCIDNIEVCCPRGTFGPDCNACVGGSERPCHDNGDCDGDGTRRGDGKCRCNKGYKGDFCLECDDGYFNKERNDTFSLCTECHESCQTCSGPTNKDCNECKSGWVQDDEKSCNDIDECANETSPCKENQYCHNKEGSYSCKACDAACTRCSGEGPEKCTGCSSGYTEEDGKCTDINECSLPDQSCLRENEDCVNTKGSFKCVCSQGFEDKDGACITIDETEENMEDEDSSETVSPDNVHEDL